ncbi:hypothetical protein BGZ88_001538, partial [Linnemannia elongata]
MRVPSVAASLALGLSLLLLTTAQSPSSSSSSSSALTPTSATTNFVLPTGAPQSTPAPQPPRTAGNATVCPGPLIPNTRGLDIPTCTEQCCLRCPAFENFYPPNKIQRIIDATFYISVLSLTISLTLWYVAFDIMPGTSNACINEAEQSTGHNSRLCGVQGVLIIYFAHTNAL